MNWKVVGQYGMGLGDEKEIGHEGDQKKNVDGPTEANSSQPVEGKAKNYHDRDVARQAFIGR